MSRLESHQSLTPSILDRLIDADSRGTAGQPGYTVAQMLQVVRRDLEDLLNTRLTVPGLPLSLTRLRESVYAYGLVDLNSLNALTPQQRDEIGKVLERTVAHFEPRLRDVRTIAVEADGGRKQAVRFRIEARLDVDPAPEVVFDTVLELTTGQTTVKQSDS
jgi:type VI secretion system protein ImpF